MEWLSNLVEWLKGKKVYILCFSAIFAAVGGYLENQLTLIQMLEAIWAAITGIAMRAGISKTAPK